MMKYSQRDIHFHLSQILMLKNPVFNFVNVETKIPYQQFLLFLCFINTLFFKKLNFFPGNGRVEATRV